MTGAREAGHTPGHASLSRRYRPVARAGFMPKLDAAARRLPQSGCRRAESAGHDDTGVLRRPSRLVFCPAYGQRAGFQTQL